MRVEDIVFACPKCRQWLESPADLCGLVVECPKCSDVITVPEQSDADLNEPASPANKPAPPRANDEMKSTTVRIELPPDLGIPRPPRKKRFILRRPS